MRAELPHAALQNIPRHKQIKRLIRGGIPSSMRHKIWLEISGAQARREGQVCGCRARLILVPMALLPMPPPVSLPALQPTLFNDLLEVAARDGCTVSPV